MLRAREILIAGESEAQLTALYNEILAGIASEPTLVEQMHARWVAADMWVANRHTAPAEAHTQEVVAQRSQAEGRRRATQEIRERGAIQAACRASAIATLRDLHELRNALSPSQTKGATTLRVLTGGRK